MGLLGVSDFGTRKIQDHFWVDVLGFHGYLGLLILIFKGSTTHSMIRHGRRPCGNPGFFMFISSERGEIPPRIRVFVLLH